MKIKKWMIGICSILVAEVILILMLSAILPVKITFGERSGSVLKAAVPEQSDPPGKCNNTGEPNNPGKLNSTDEPNNPGKLNSTDKPNNPGKLNSTDEPNSSGKKHRSTSNNSNRNRRKERKIYNSNKKNLVLVNKEHALDISYDAALKPICNGRLYASERLYDSLVQMLSDAQQQGGWRYWIASAYRSREKQQRLIDDDVSLGMKKGLSYEEALQQAYEETMPAGYSEHETGLALDILCSDNTNMDTSQAEEPANIWLCENSYRYGFILRYPKKKEHITGISYEPWHFRYVGKTAAAYMTKHNITLEEFWDRLDLK